jgi:hypothetical protein
MGKAIKFQTQSSHPWHGVEPDWENNLINAIIEIPKGKDQNLKLIRNPG